MSCKKCSSCCFLLAPLTFKAFIATMQTFLRHAIKFLMIKRFSSNPTFYTFKHLKCSLKKNKIKTGLCIFQLIAFCFVFLHLLIAFFFWNGLCILSCRCILHLCAALDFNIAQITRLRSSKYRSLWSCVLICLIYNSWNLIKVSLVQLALIVLLNKPLNIMNCYIFQTSDCCRLANYLS